MILCTDIQFPYRMAAILYIQYNCHDGLNYVVFYTANSDSGTVVHHPMAVRALLNTKIM